MISSTIIKYFNQRLITIWTKTGKTKKKQAKGDAYRQGTQKKTPTLLTSKTPISLWVVFCLFCGFYFAHVEVSSYCWLINFIRVDDSTNSYVKSLGQWWLDAMFD